MNAVFWKNCGKCKKSYRQQTITYKQADNNRSNKGLSIIRTKLSCNKNLFRGCISYRNEMNANTNEE